MIHYTGSISRSVGSYWFSCIFAGTIVASSLPRLIVPGFASSGWRNRIWTLMRFPLGTSTNRQSRIRRSITGTTTEFLSCNKIAREIFTTHVCASVRIFPIQHRLTSTITSKSLPAQYVLVCCHCLWHEYMTIYISYFGRNFFSRFFYCLLKKNYLSTIARPQQY